MAGKMGPNNPCGLSCRSALHSVLTMALRNTVTFYLPLAMRRRAEAGEHNFIARLSEVLTQAGYSVAFDDDDQIARFRAMVHPGRGIFLMEPPVNQRTLTMRRTYIYPFWHLEAGAERWDWPVAQASFAPDPAEAAEAVRFFGFWQRRLFGDAPLRARKDGFVLVPLQSQLLLRRSFQQASPIDMLRAVLAHDPHRDVIATLHPKEEYSEGELQALSELAQTHEKLFIQPGGNVGLLQACDYVVTQNSGTGFKGYFFNKPLILFAKADFHHIALNVAALGEKAAFARIAEHTPDYAAYLYWFLQRQAINAGRPDTHDQIRKVLQRHGWIAKAKEAPVGTPLSR